MRCRLETAKRYRCVEARISRSVNDCEVLPTLQNLMWIVPFEGWQR